MAGLIGMQDLNADQMSNKFEEMLATIRQVNAQFKNAVSVSFVANRISRPFINYLLFQ